MKIGFKIKYVKNIPDILPNLSEFQGKLDFFELGVRVGEDFHEYEVLKDKGFAFTIHAPFQENEVNLIDPTKKTSTHEGIKIAKEAADFFKAPVIVFHPGDKETDQASLDYLVGLFKQFADERFLVENLPRVGNSRPFTRLCISIREIKYIQEKTGAGFCLDFGHALVEANIEKREYYSYIKEMILKLKPTYFHLSGCDGKVDRHWKITDKQSAIDYQKIIPLLPKDAWLTLEVYVFDEPDGFNEAGLKRDVDYLRKLLLTR